MPSVIGTLLFAVLQVASVATPATSPPLTGDEAEHFLRTAEVVHVTDFKNLGVTRPRKVELSDGVRTHSALFKTVDEYAMRQRFDDGTVELHFSDCYRYEIAAYELDKLLGLGLVPPVVERTVGRETGSLSLWVDAMPEAERLKDGVLHPPDLHRWNDQIQTLRLFLQLICDTDFRNMNNILVTSDWRIYKIDASRAFRTWKKLEPDLPVERFSKRLLQALEALDRESLDASLGPWLENRQIEALWQRRALLLELADSLAAERGEAAVFFE